MRTGIPGMDEAAAQHLVDAAHGVHPRANVTRGSLDVSLAVV